MEQYGDCANIFINFQSDRENYWAIEVRWVKCDEADNINIDENLLNTGQLQIKRTITEFISDNVAATDKLNTQVCPD
jgi:hypothetical protein